MAHDGSWLSLYLLTYFMCSFNSKKSIMHSNLVHIFYYLFFSILSTESGSACAKHTCQPGATCKEKNGFATCECPECSSDYDPVCGSNGMSYQNDCRLRLEACTTNASIQVMYNGLCSKCKLLLNVNSKYVHSYICMYLFNICLYS